MCNGAPRARGGREQGAREGPAAQRVDVRSLPAARRCERRAGSDEAEWQQLIAQHTSVMLYPSSSTSQNCARTDGHTGLPIGVTCFSNMHSMLQCSV